MEDVLFPYVDNELYLYLVALLDHPNPLMMDLDDGGMRKGAKRKRGLSLADELGGKRRSARVSLYLNYYWPTRKHALVILVFTRLQVAMLSVLSINMRI